MIQLSPRAVEKPWGVTRLPEQFQAIGGQRIGEIWFESAESARSLPLLVKYLFTSESLSVQVHPDDEQAKARGLKGGKEECWYIIDADPGAALGIGTTKPFGSQELMTAARTGEIKEYIEWHPVAPGDLIHIPPGTIHAIGAGITLLEIQQTTDVTYRLYDYGRPRELHLAEASEVADARPFPSGQLTHVDPERSAILLEAKHFTIAQIVDDHCRFDLETTREIMVIPIAGTIKVGSRSGKAGDCFLKSPKMALTLQPGSRAILAWSR
jgi:mannose-6-phosphate isomerase